MTKETVEISSNPNRQRITEMQAIYLGVTALTENGWYDFPATRIRGTHPADYTPEQIAEMSDEELMDYMISDKIIEVSAFRTELID